MLRIKIKWTKRSINPIISLGMVSKTGMRFRQRTTGRSSVIGTIRAKYGPSMDYMEESIEPMRGRPEISILPKAEDIWGHDLFDTVLK